MGQAAPGAALRAAEEAAELAHADPAEALRRAEAVLAGAEDTEARVVATWAAGLAHRELGALDRARSSFEVACAAADAAGLTGRAARARLSWALVATYLGDADGALYLLDAAHPHLQGVEAGHCDVQRSLVLTRLGRLDEALRFGARALPVLREGGDRLAAARLLSNMGVLHAYRGELDAAEAVLAEAAGLARDLDQTLLLARTQHNQAYARGRAGDVPGALARYDVAAATYRELEHPHQHLAVLEADRAELLLAAGLAHEALARAEQSLGLQTATENVVDRGEALLLVARCRLAAGQGDAAAASAADAAASLAEHGRAAWADLARAVALEAGSGTVDDALHLAADLDARGWVAESHRARWLAAQRCAAEGRLGDAAEVVAPVGRAALAGPAAVRSLGWSARAHERAWRGDRRGARRAAAAGLRVVDRARATLGATELRAHAAHAGLDLARLGLRLAVEDGRPREALRWIESLRAVSVLTPAPRPPEDGELAAELAQLRAAHAERAAAATPVEVAEATARIAALEDAVVHRTRLLRGDGGAVQAPPLDRTTAALGDRVLLAYASLDGELLAVVVRDGRTSLQALGAVAPLVEEAASAVFSLRRLARAGVSAASAEAARRALDHSLAALGEALVAPVRRRLGGRPAVVVPPGALRRLPWHALPTFAGAPVSVAPSAAAWTLAHERDDPDAGVLLAAGPDLPGAVAEVDALLALHGEARALRPPASTVDAVLGALGPGTAHVAAHGTFRAGNAQLSSLLLSDGPLTLHDLGRASRQPVRWVLSACDAAASTAPAGDEILGLGAGLLALGASSLVAPITPVPDAATVPAMLDLHRALRAGCTAAEAVAALAAEPADDPAARAAQVAFTALGA